MDQEVPLAVAAGVSSVSSLHGDPVGEGVLLVLNGGEVACSVDLLAAVLVPTGVKVTWDVTFRLVPLLLEQLLLLLLEQPLMSLLQKLLSNTLFM